MDDADLRIVMVIDGHDWRYTGDGMHWLEPDHPEYKTPDGSWSNLRRRGYTQKQCMTCGYIGKPKDDVEPCHKVWSDMTGHPSSNGVDVYYPKARNEQKSPGTV